MYNLKDTISVTVDKSHIISIGERLYSESIELIRELVANSYDADATRVDIIIKNEEIVICDDGEGMDRKGLEQFFNIGSPFKRINRKSPKFNRERIGEFGIGKFAVLSCASYFEVITRKGDFCARVIFDKEKWDESYDWKLPLEILPSEHRSYDGTTIILRKLKKTFEISRVEERLRETLPLRSENFSVYLNQKIIMPRISLGHKIPFLESTNFGIVYGEIVIVSSALSDIRKAGIEIRVKGVLVKREMFGLDAFVKDISRIQGEVNADFLVLTTDRTDIIKDNEQYKEFMNVMNKVIVRVKDVIKDFFEFKESRRAKRILDDVLDKIKKVLILNPNICPEGLVPLGEDLENSIGGQLAYVS
ncbi:MAG: ATP-binding protein, partial [Candidatus Omnitrophica bacterium]|nr:ATP-binding protein [Candidatus Omnitrophota bacterium]